MCDQVCADGSVKRNNELIGECERVGISTERRRAEKGKGERVG